jgi:hypothetical protein
MEQFIKMANKIHHASCASATIKCPAICEESDPRKRKE